MNAPSNRLERIEASLDRSENLLERQLTTLTTPEQQKQRLAEHERIIAQNEAMIGRLDAMLEWLIYREGREEQN